MPTKAHHPTGPLRLAALLAAVAGFVDAHIYLNVVNVFVANMSGNMIHLGIFTGEFAWRNAEAPVVAILGFVSGVIVATAYHTRRRRAGLAVQPHVLVWAEAILIALMTAGLCLWHPGFSTKVSAGDLAFVALGAAAMGIQTAALRRVRSVQIATTYGTGTIVRIGEKAVSHMAARGNWFENNGGLHNVPVIILVTVLLSYIGGAGLASFLGAEHWLLLGPVAALVWAGVSLRPLRRQSHASHPGS